MEREGFGRRKPQIVVHVEALCQVHHEKASEKDPQSRLLNLDGYCNFI